MPETGPVINDGSFAGHFSLGMLARVAGKIVPPEAPLDAGGAWAASYTHYTLIHNNRAKPVYGIPAGILKLVREAPAGDRARMRFELLNFLKGECSHRIAGEIEYAPDELATPISWSYTTEFCAPVDGSGPAERLRYAMRIRGGEVELRSGAAVRSVRKPAWHSCAWTLFDAVQRLPRKPETQFKFAYWDRLQVPRPDHVLRYREALSLAFPAAPSRQVKLHGFEQLGEGLLPTVFWTDDSGRLLMYSSGIQAFVLERQD